MRRSGNRWTIAGIVLVIVGLLGFVTVADDLRHLGEVVGVGTILVIGILLIFGGRTESTKRRIGSFCLAGGLALGALVGAAIDHVVVGTCGGFVVGGVVAAAIVWHAASRNGETTAKV